jgi:hypothetical protein
MMSNNKKTNKKTILNPKYHQRVLNNTIKQTKQKPPLHKTILI